MFRMNRTPARLSDLLSTLLTHSMHAGQQYMKWTGTTLREPSLKLAFGVEGQ